MVLPEPSLKYSHTAVVFIQDTSNRDGQMFFPFFFFFFLRQLLTDLITFFHKYVEQYSIDFVGGV